MKKICQTLSGLGLLLSLLIASCLPPPVEPTPTPTATSTAVPSPTPTPTFTPVLTGISVKSPVAGGAVDLKTTIEGISQNIPDGSVIWIVIYLPSVNRYYPADKPAVVQKNGEWASLAQFGLEGESGLKADIIVVLADDNVQTAFTAYLTAATTTGKYEGMDGLPAGDIVYDRISVIRR